MIDIRELRIGNHIIFNGTRVEVIGIEVSNDEDVPEVITVHEVLDTGEFNIPCDSCELDPIPLTPELVEEIGFEKGEASKESKIFYQDPICKKLIQKCQKNPELAKEFAEQTFCSLFHYENEEKKEVWLLICEKGQVYVSYLHELENMYHYLTGREL